MAEYRKHKDDTLVVRTADKANIPRSMNNTDWVTYQKWLAAGNVPDPWIDPVPLAAYSADVRFQTETAPLMVGAMLLAMDRLSQERLATIVGSFVVLKGKTSVDYKAMNGFFAVNETLAKDMHAAVQVHIQTCFTREKNVLAAITAGTITTKTQIDAAFADMAAPLPLIAGGQTHGTADEPATEPERRARGAHADRRSAHADHRDAADARHGAAVADDAAAEAEGEPAPAADRADAAAEADAATSWPSG
jgi:hypothetical protein